MIGILSLYGHYLLLKLFMVIISTTINQLLLPSFDVINDSSNVNDK
jgi:hypothetical protein